MKSMSLLVAVLGLVAVAGCDNNDKPQTPAPTTNKVATGTAIPAAAAASPEYYEVSSKGRTYVVGSKAMADKAEKGTYPQLTVTKIGYGVSGETVVFEVGKEPALERRLMAEYDTRHKK